MIKARLFGLLAAVLALSLVAGAAQESTGELYAPGAFVTLAVQVQAPAEWALNPQVPLRIKFEDTALKSSNFKVAATSYDFKVGKSDASYIAEIPIKISPSYAADLLEVPLSVACSICTLDESSCTFVNDEVRARLRVRAGKSADGVPQKKGTLRLSHVLSTP